MALSRAWIISLSAFLLLSESLISARALESSAATGIFNEAAIPSPVAGAREITFGRGGWWFTEFAANKVGRLGPSGDVVEFAIPTANSGPLGIAYDGVSDAIWFTEFNANKIGRVTPAGVVTEFSIPTPSSGPVGIAVLSGSVWFTESSANKIGRLTPAGAFTEFPIPTPNSEPMGVSVLSSAVWFTEFQGNKLGKIALSLDGNFAALTEMPIPTSNSGPVSVSFIGTDVWFTETIANKIGLLRSDGFLEFPVPTQNSGLSGIYSNYYEGIAWFTESRGNKIGFVTEDGRFTEYALPTPASEPFGITAGQVNGQIVFTERTGNAVSRFQGDALVVLAARDLGGWTTEFDIANVEAQKTFILGSFAFPEITVCGVCPPQLLLPLGPHGSAKATASQVTLGSLRSVFFRSLVDGVLPNVHARLVSSAAPRGSIEAPSIRLSTLAALDPSTLVFPGAVRQAGAHSNLLITEVSTLSYLRFINTNLQVLVEAFSDTGELVGSASFGVVGDSGSIYLVDILGQLGVAELPLGQLRVTKTGGGGIMWGYLLTAKSDGTFAVSLGATP